MLKTIISGIAGLFLALAVVVAPAYAAEQGSVDEAKAMAEKAAALLSSAGKDKAFEAFNNSGDFKDRDLYVFVVDNAGITVAHGANAALIGRNLMEVRDPAGKQFVKEMVGVSDKGWVEYVWQNPASKAVEPKKSYVIREGDVVVGVGAYVK
ncbi:MAG: cache domain-containing protein [Thalassobaculaceae bacterium]|nr:cache domain-containing protein [Thalassobaculaceae bacterium]